MVRDCYLGHQLLLLPAKWCPIFASRTTGFFEISLLDADGGLVARASQVHLSLSSPLFSFLLSSSSSSLLLLLLLLPSSCSLLMVFLFHHKIVAQKRTTYGCLIFIATSAIAKNGSESCAIDLTVRLRGSRSKDKRRAGMSLLLLDVAVTSLGRPMAPCV